jgi:hypothetical protein
MHQPSTIELMKLVSLDLIGSDAWEEALDEHGAKVRAFQSLVSDVTILPNGREAGR